MGRRGFSLVELMLAVTILTMVVGMVATLGLSMKSATLVQDAAISTHGETTGAMVRISRELRQAAASSMTWPQDEQTSLTYQVAADLDGNGVAVDGGGFLELSVPRAILRDVDDLNGDGRTVTQLILDLGNNNFAVLANDLAPNEDANGNGVLDAGEDQNFNNRLERGILFERVGGGVRVTVESQRRPGPQTQPVVSGLTMTIQPRN